MGRPTSRAILVASLALNLFLASAFLALIWLNVRGVNRPAPSAGPLRLVAAKLDAPHSQALLSILRSNGQLVRPLNRRARALRFDAWQALEAPAFDPASVKAELAEARALNQKAGGVVQDSLVDFAAALPVDQRAALGKALVARLPPIRSSKAISLSPSAKEPPTEAKTQGP